VGVGPHEQLINSPGEESVSGAQAFGKARQRSGGSRPTTCLS